MEIEKYNSVTAFYYADNVEKYVVKDIVNTVYSASIGLLDSINSPTPRVSFNLGKFNDELGYQITFDIRGSLSDHQLLLIKRIYNALRKKYKISIVVNSNNGEEFKYTNKNYWIALLKNNLPIYLLLPIVVMVTFAISNFIFGLFKSFIKSETIRNIISDTFIPLLGYPLSIFAFVIKPMIFSTKFISCVIILLSAFAFYLITGNGLYGSFLLLVLYILKSIQDSL